MWRDGRAVKVSATTAELPVERAASAAGGGPDQKGGDLGLELQTMTPDLAQLRLQAQPSMLSSGSDRNNLIMCWSV